MSCDVSKAIEGLGNELWRRWSDGKWWMNRAHSPTFPSSHLRRSSFSNLSVISPTSQLILQPFRCFTYVTAQSPIIPSLHLRHSSFSNPSVALPTSQLILQPFRCFTYVTAHYPTLPLLHLSHSSFSNPSFASPTSQARHLRHLASRTWVILNNWIKNILNSLPLHQQSRTRWLLVLCQQWVAISASRWHWRELRIILY